MVTLLRAIRYLVIVPIFGLVLAAAAFFFFGGINLILTLIGAIFNAVTDFGPAELQAQHVPFLIEVVEYVHTFLVGTVLLITAIGFYQLFIRDIDLPDWLDVEGTEELETALIGVTVVVIAVHFMTVVFVGSDADLLAEGLGTGAVILSLGAFIGLRAWGERQKQLGKSGPKAEEPPESSDQNQSR